MPQYTHIPQCDESGEKDNSIDGAQETYEYCGSQRCYSCFLRRERLLIYVILFISIVFLTANIFLAASLYVKTRGSSDADSNSSSTPSCETAIDKVCVQRLSSYTPAFDAIEYFETNIYDAFGNGDKYRGPPTAERDQTWHELWQYEAIMVESWAMPVLNRTDLGPYERIDTETSDGYTAMLKVHHQLGCLDMIRQYTWLLGGKYPEHLIPLELQKSPEENWLHINRCIEDLRISLMCQGDMTPLLITKDRDPESGYKAELNSHHKCRNFTKLQEWTKKHGVEHWENGGGFHQHDDRA